MLYRNRNGVLLPAEHAACMQQVRVEIGRRLKEYYDNDARPMPDRLAALVRKIEHRKGNVKS